MRIQRLLVANRGEIAIRIMRTAADLGIETVAIYSADDANSLHVRKATRSAQLKGTGAAAYLDVAEVIGIATGMNCDAVHPGYGFLSENPALPESCLFSGLTFVGPAAEILFLFGNKAHARDLAYRHDIPIVDGTRAATSLEEAKDFFGSLRSGEQMIIKALAGGGGRGVRIVSGWGDLEDAFNRCQSEAGASFGNPDLYVEVLLPKARHVEVQIVGDGTGQIVQLGDRDCSIQRQQQKVLEIAPAPGLLPATRRALAEAAITLGQACHYSNIGTFEFLVDCSHPDRFMFMEANPRLQVEHTITEAITGIDLVEVQLRLAAGETLADIGLSRDPELTGSAIQVRVNMETMTVDGNVLPGGGVIDRFNVPSGPGVRIDTFGYPGYSTNPRFDSLLAKVIVHSRGSDFPRLLGHVYRALCEFEISGIPTNLDLSRALLQHPALASLDFHTRFVEENITSLLRETDHPRLYFTESIADVSHQAGATLDSNDPLAVLQYGRQTPERSTVRAGGTGPGADIPGEFTLLSPMQGTVLEIVATLGEPVAKGATVIIMDSMKMEHEVRTTVSGIVSRINVHEGNTIFERHALLVILEQDVADAAEIADASVDPTDIRPDLAEVNARRAYTLDQNRPEAVARRRDKNLRTARENVEHLCDDGTFIEYGGLVLAAQRRRRSLQDLIEKTPADGMITGVGSINGRQFGDPASRCVILAYDYTVLAGTQGKQNHRKTDRMIGVAEEGRMPLLLFAEGGGGRPGDTDGIAGETSTTFARFAQLSGLVPVVGITTGRCFAGNASLLGCCDVIIATKNANIGMGGPAMIEGGGLGVFAPEDIGPMSVQVPNGVVDILVADEAEAVETARRYLSYFQGVLPGYQSGDQRLMRQIVPENRLRVYDVRQVISTLADTGSVLELRAAFGPGIITSLVRVEGMPLGIVANNPAHLGGAIDADGADKAARFMQLLDAFDIPLLHLCDTPGIMVGPEIEKTALVRHSSRMFITGANLSIPFFTIVLRKAYGLGAIAMAGGSWKTPYFAVAWPTGEFGGMGLEGSVKLGFRDELAAIEDPAERRKRYETMVAAAYESGKALNYASNYAVDDTIDPADSRRWVVNLMHSIRSTAPRTGKKRPAVDAW